MEVHKLICTASEDPTDIDGLSNKDIWLVLTHRTEVIPPAEKNINMSYTITYKYQA